MPRAVTQYFGPVDYDESDVLAFPSGLPGFESAFKFLAIEQPSARPLVFLQSLQPGGPCFVTLPVHLVTPDYALRLGAAELETLGFPPDSRPAAGRELLCLTVISMNEEGWTANLLAPVVVHVGRGIAVQVVQQESDYSIRHRLEFTPEMGQVC